ncbi:hypothetical protein HMN09_00128500 [Mycena chlorophos]|uniref:Uncharacterized protein n=1 Tax=Mycena chlorophos TaxID=658473 RepID=A0A8H6TTL4_MYCCL|nr:hypothetical protein HMN09_00128500 [Mycena chlorophos]
MLPLRRTNTDTSHVSDSELEREEERRRHKAETARKRPRETRNKTSPPSSLQQYDVVCGYYGARITALEQEVSELRDMLQGHKSDLPCFLRSRGRVPFPSMHIPTLSRPRRHCCRPGHDVDAGTRAHADIPLWYAAQSAPASTKGECTRLYLRLHGIEYFFSSSKLVPNPPASLGSPSNASKGYFSRLSTTSKPPNRSIPLQPNWVFSDMLHAAIQVWR